MHSTAVYVSSHAESTGGERRGEGEGGREAKALGIKQINCKLHGETVHNRWSEEQVYNDEDWMANGSRVAERDYAG